MAELMLFLFDERNLLKKSKTARPKWLKVFDFSYLLTKDFTKFFFNFLGGYHFEGVPTLAKYSKNQDVLRNSQVTVISGLKTRLSIYQIN